MAAENLIGQKYGRLTVISRSVNSARGISRWVCLCDCNKTLIVYSNLLKSGNTRSCGCLIGFSDRVLSSKRLLFYRYKHDAEKRGLSFPLSFDDLMAITQRDCYYCGVPPCKYLKKMTAREGFFYNGIDRLDNLRGYEQENIVPCCKDCNWAKMDLTQEAYMAWIKKCYNHLKENNMLNTEEAK